MGNNILAGNSNPSSGPNSTEPQHSTVRDYVLDPNSGAQQSFFMGVVKGIWDGLRMNQEERTQYLADAAAKRGMSLEDYQRGLDDMIAAPSSEVLKTMVDGPIGKSFE